MLQPANPPLPIVAIVGRPNVGKSTLFNRYARRRRALVEDTPGLTRDRLAEEVEAGGRRVLVVDTAGLDPDAEGELGEAVQAQARAAVAEADAILFVVDAKTGLLPQDEALARELRRTARPLVLVVNKIDSPRHEARAGEFHRLGVEPLFLVSAEHGRGVWEALEAAVAQLPARAATAERPEGALRAGEPESGYRVALVGRPNVGKSSLLNRLAGGERVVVSQEPGTTRDAVDLRIERPDGVYIVVDTAGLRRPGRRDRVAERASALAALRAIERAEVALVVLDASEGVTDLDARIAGWVRERGCAAAILVNKWDLVAGGGREVSQRVRAELARRLRFVADAPVLTVSARTGTRTERIWPLVRRLAATTRKRIPTAELNRWLQAATAAHAPSMGQRGSRKRPLKFFYATQVGTRPPSFVAFCTDPSAVQPSYRRYLENALRARFGFQGVPVRLALRGRRRPWRDEGG